MNLSALLPCTLPLLLAACTSATMPPEVSAVKAFDYRLMEIHADTRFVTIARPITITTEVTPLVSGKGRISMYISMSNREQIWEILAPVQRAVAIPPQLPDMLTPTFYSVEFTANQRLAVPWQIQLHISRDYYIFSARALLASVFVADSNRYFPVWSHEARARTPGGYGYDDVAAFDELILSR
ncbi:MAG: hypothetical protein JST22_12440 [Bacteroidetes bacterium]|nr:hypothetical protein [Bacteroidota bacterium]